MQPNQVSWRARYGRDQLSYPLSSLETNLILFVSALYLSLAVGSSCRLGYSYLFIQLNQSDIYAFLQRDLKI